MLGDQVYADDTHREIREFISPPRHPAAAQAPRSPTSRSTPGSTTRRGGASGPLAPVQRADLDDLRRPRRPGRLEHVPRVAASTCRRRRGGRSGSPARSCRTGCTSTSATSRPTRSRPTRRTGAVRGAGGRRAGPAQLRPGRRPREPTGQGAMWSYRQDFGRVRLVVIDSRCGRILADRRRSMISEAEFRWIESRSRTASTTTSSWGRRCRGCCRARSTTSSRGMRR